MSWRSLGANKIYIHPGGEEKSAWEEMTTRERAAFVLCIALLIAVPFGFLAIPFIPCP